MAQWSIERKVLAGFGLTVAALVAIGVVLTGTTLNLIDTNAAAARTQQGLLTLERIYSVTREAESRQRAYLLLGAFADAHLAGLTPGELSALEALLEEQDQDIYDWYLGKSPVPPEHDTPLFALLKAFDFFPRASWS